MKCQKSKFRIAHSFSGLIPGLLGWASPEQLGSSSIAKTIIGWFHTCPNTMGSCFDIELQVWRH